MRVLSVGNLYPPHHFGGYEQVWQSAVGYLRRNGHEVRVLAADYRHPGCTETCEADVHRTLRWYWSEHEFSWVPFRTRVGIERHNHRQLAFHLRDFEPDVLTFWSMGGMSHSLIEAGRRAGVPLVAFVHDQWLDYGRFTDRWLRQFDPRNRSPMTRLAGPRRVAGWVAEAVFRVPARVNYGAARYVFVSHFVRDRANELGLGLSDVAVAHSGIAPVFGHPAPPHSWTWRLLHVGRLHPDKGIEDAVRCLVHLPAEATLTFAGNWDPRDESALAELVRELQLQSRVTMLGSLGREQVANLYREFDAVLFPVRWDEPWGLVPLEAMACGCPVIATGRGGSGEYLRDGDNCLLVGAADPAALAAAVERLASESELRDRLRQGGIATASEHTEDAFNSSVERHLREVSVGTAATGRTPATMRAATRALPR